MRREIVILTRSLPFHGAGGMEIAAWDLAKAFARLGHTVRIITTSLPSNDEEVHLDGVQITPLRGTPGGKYSHAWWENSREYFEHNCMDSTQAVISVSAAGFGVLKLKKHLPDIPFIMQAHGTSWGEVISKWRSAGIKNLLSSVRNFLWLPKDLIAYKHFDAVAAVGPRVFNDLNSLPAKLFLRGEKIHLINNGIDNTLFHPSQESRTRIRAKFKLAAQQPVLFSASRLHVQKGVSNVLKAFAILHRLQPDVILLIAGDGPDRSRLEALSRRLKINDHVLFLGTLDRIEIAEIYQSSDIFVFLSEHMEGLPLNILEALASGLPCILSEHLHLFPSDHIHRLSHDDFEGIAQKIASLIPEASDCKKSLLPEIFHLSNSANEYLSVISSLERKNPH